MRTIKGLVGLLASFIIGSNAFAWSVAEFYYTMNSSTIQPIAPGVNPVLIHTGPVSWPSYERAFFNAVNIANNAAGSTFIQFSPDYWSAAQWTGLEPTDRSAQSQAGLSYGGALPSYGNNVFQVDSGRVGMFLNTYNLTPPNSLLTSSQQFARVFSPKPTIWSQFDASSLLCVNGVVDLHSWEGPNAQAMMTMAFDERGTDRFFFINVMMLDTNASHGMVERVMMDNSADTGAPIAIAYFQSQNSPNPLGRYSSVIPGYGALLEGYSTRASKGASYASDQKHYGVCMSRSQFANILQDIRSSRPNFSPNPQDYVLSTALWASEIAGPGVVGMSINAYNIYRITP